MEAGTQRWELKERPRKNTTYWLATWLAPPASCTTQHHLPRGGTVQSRLGFPYPSLIQKMYHRPIWWNYFLG